MSTMIGNEVQAQRKHVGIPAQKVRLVINQVRGMRAEDALTTLKFMPQAAAQEIYKTINSALANAEQNEGLAREDMWISEIYADVGPTRKWRRFGARGRFKPILKRSSHITVVLSERS
ncbi:MAG TPA: 50S ribosomal protein L22 [Denitromonas sp.]|nr:50S ribosomal protein L22 [Anaerolineae bacterium]HPR07836.1 50S ribosomal protein L22 [Denitromonas sp.]